MSNSCYTHQTHPCIQGREIGFHKKTFFVARGCLSQKWLRISPLENVSWLILTSHGTPCQIKSVGRANWMISCDHSIGSKGLRRHFLVERIIIIIKLSTFLCLTKSNHRSSLPQSILKFIHSSANARQRLIVWWDDICPKISRDMLSVDRIGNCWFDCWGM